MIDVANLLEPVSLDAPCGEDLEYDEAFVDLQLIAQHKPEQQMGDAIIAAEEPAWGDVENKALELFERTKDLRVTVHLIKALIHTRGFVGAAKGFEVLRGLLEDLWHGVHPQLDPDDDNDPMMRFNILADLADASTVLKWVRKMPMVTVRGIGSFSLRDWELASGEVTPTQGETAPEMGLIEAAFREAPLEEVEPMAVAARACATDIATIENLLTGYADGTSPPNLTPLRELLTRAAKAMETKLVERGAVPSDGVDQADVDALAAAGAPSVASAAVHKGLSGDITSRRDVVKALDKILKYYESNEPSSPLPILLGRCKKLVDMSFMEIIRDLAPDGVSQIETLRGPSEEEDDY